MVRTLIVLGCLLILLVPAPASFAAEEGAPAATLDAAGLQQEASSADRVDFVTWLAQQDISASPAAPTLPPHESKAGCTATFCMRCADACCPSSAGGCLCC